VLALTFSKVALENRQLLFVADPHASPDQCQSASKKEKAKWLKPGLVGRVRFLKGEEKLRHAKLLDFRDKQ
jgi:hypothetical protein